MGAENEVYQVKAKSILELKQRYSELVEQAQYEDGHGGYTGTIAESPGLTILSSEFESYEEAEDFICKTAQKWENSLAAKIKGKDAYVIGGCYSS